MVDDGQTQSFAALALAGLLGDPDELVAPGGHLGQALVGEDEDLLEAGLQHPGGQGRAGLVLPAGEVSHPDEVGAGAGRLLIGGGRLLDAVDGPAQVLVGLGGACLSGGGLPGGGVRLGELGGGGLEAVLLLAAQGGDLRVLQPQADPLMGGGGGAHAGRQGLDGTAFHECRRCLGRTGEALLCQRGGQVGQGAAGLGQGGAGCVDVLGGVLGLLGPHEERGGAGGDARPGPVRLQAALLVLGEGLALGLQAAAGGLLGGAGGIERGALLLGAVIEGLEPLDQLLDAVGCGPRRGQGGGGRLQRLLGGGGFHAVTGALGLLKLGGTGVALPDGGAERLVGLPLVLLGGLDLLAGCAVGAGGGRGGVRGRATHGAGIALGELTGERPGGPGDPGQAGGANPFGRLPRERRRLSAGIVSLGELGAELLDGEAAR